MPPAGMATSTPGSAARPRDEQIAAGAQALHQRGHEVGRNLQRRQAAALHEHRRAGGVELDQLAGGVEMAARQHQPAQAPAGHQEALGKAVRHHQPVFVRGDVEEARGSQRRAPKWMRSYTSSATIQVPVRRQCARIASCSSRVSVHPVGLLGAFSSSTLGGRCHCRAQFVQVQRPLPVPRPQRDAPHRRTHDGRLGRQVGPQRHHRHHLVDRRRPASAWPASAHSRPTR